jgi:hypothetical protein
MWYAHRCTVYDNLVKDEIAREIVPRKLEIPRMEVKMPVRVPEAVAERPSAPASEEKAERLQTEPLTTESQSPLSREAPQAPTSPPRPEQIPLERSPPEAPRPTRSPEAEEALQRLRGKWLKNA